jgi:hypothetical protein
VVNICDFSQRFNAFYHLLLPRIPWTVAIETSEVDVWRVTRERQGKCVQC